MIQPREVFDFESFAFADSSGEASWHVPADCPYLDGHFPGQPVLPAVGLLDGSLELIRRCGTLLPAGQLQLKKAKFTGMVVPGMKVRVKASHRENRWDIEWKRETGETLASFSFRL